MCESHQFSVTETVLCGVQAVRDALANVQNFDHFTSVVTGLTAMSENEFSGIGRPLFLRDRISLRRVCAPEVGKLLALHLQVSCYRLPPYDQKCTIIPRSVPAA